MKFHGNLQYIFTYIGFYILSEAENIILVLPCCIFVRFCEKNTFSDTKLYLKVTYGFSVD